MDGAPFKGIPPSRARIVLEIESRDNSFLRARKVRGVALLAYL